MTYYVTNGGELEGQFDSLDKARKEGAKIAKNEYLYVTKIYRDRSFLGEIKYIYGANIWKWYNYTDAPFKLIDPKTGKAHPFPKGLFIIKYTPNRYSTDIKTDLLKANGIDDLRKKLIQKYGGDASAEATKYLGNIYETRDGRYVWRVLVDMRMYVFRDCDVDPKTGKLIGKPRRHAPYEEK